MKWTYLAIVAMVGSFSLLTADNDESTPDADEVVVVDEGDVAQTETPPAKVEKKSNCGCK